MKETSPLQAVYDRPGFLLKRCHQLAAAIFVERCADFNLTPSQYGALCALHAHPGVDQIALGRLIGLDRSTVGLVIRLLRARRLLDREVNVADKRRMRLRLSAAGVRLLAQVAPVAQRVQEEVLSGLPKSRRALFLSLLREFVEGHGATIVPSDIVGSSAPPQATGATRRANGAAGTRGGGAGAREGGAGVRGSAAGVRGSGARPGSAAASGRGGAARRGAAARSGTATKSPSASKRSRRATAKD